MSNLVPQSVSNAISSIDVRLTTEDVANLAIAKRRKILQKKLDELNKQMSKAHLADKEKRMYAKSVERARLASFKDEIAELKSKYGKNVSYSVVECGKTNRLYVNIQIRKPRSNAEKDLIKARDAKTTEISKIYDRIKKVKDELANIEETRVNVKAKLAEWKLKQIGADEILSQLDM